MSINYYGLPTRDEALIGPILEGGDVDVSIDAANTRAALIRETPLAAPSPRGTTLRWEGGDGYIFVDVLSNHVIVTQGGDGGDEQIEVMIDVISTLQGTCALHVYDPQQGRFW